MEELIITTYRKAKPAERNDLIDFGNYVFSQAHQPHDFKKLVPKMYDDSISSEYMADNHWICVIQERVKAMVACPIMDIDYAGVPLKFGMIGTVSVHPYHRGGGHMISLMWTAVDDRKANGVDMIVLGGQRQRYNYYGFEKAGNMISFTVTHKNIYQTFDFEWKRLPEMKFEELKKGDPRLETALDLYNKQVIHSARTKENFLLYAHNWAAKVYAIMNKEGAMVGYVCAGDKEHFNELVLADEGLLSGVLRSWMNSMEAGCIHIDVMPHEKERIKTLHAYAEDYSISNCEMILPVKWANCIRAALAYKKLYTKLEDGEQVFRLDGQGVRVVVKDGEPEVTEVGEDVPADVTLEGAPAVLAMYSPIAEYVDSIKWTPLPFALSAQDKF